MKSGSVRFWIVALAGLAAAGLLPAGGVEDAMRTPPLRDVRIKGVPGEKLRDLIRERIAGPFAQKNIFGEARRAFRERDDDILGWGGKWRGEFWGKLMLGAARVADYLQDPALLAFVRDECHRAMAYQDADGYLGSYADKGLVSITNMAATKKVYGWDPVWTIWNRKYAMWGMLMAYKATGDRAILDSVVRQMDQLIAMLKGRNLRLRDTGTPQMNGLPSMSILKPLVMLYAETGKADYLAFAADTLKDWDRDDNACPNLFRNAFRPGPVYDWYPELKLSQWPKAYEFMSCLAGLVEYHRATGDARCLATARAIAETLYRTDSNVFGGVGAADKLWGAPRLCAAYNEVCDIIHWIRLNIDLYLVTGEEKYVDRVERAYFNGYLAGIWRGGADGPFFLRGQGRNDGGRGSCGYAYNHCCVNNLPRTFMDIASVTVTRDRAGGFHVNVYQDASATLDGVAFEISGNYPVGSRVTVRTSKPVKPIFRRPSWCPKMDVAVAADGCTWTLDFDMNTRVVDRLETVAALSTRDPKHWIYDRYLHGKDNPDLVPMFRTTPAAYVMHGPLLLAKSRLVGATRAEMFTEASINGKGYAARVTPLKGDGMTWGCWRLELAKPGCETIRVNVCDYQSGTDMPASMDAELFSIWF